MVDREAARGPVGSSAGARRFVTRVVNPLIRVAGLAGGERSMFGVLQHVGRTSGRRHEHPVLPHVAGDVVLIPLSFGTEVNWVRNVLATGSAQLRFRGRRLPLMEPEIVPLGDVSHILPAEAHRAYERMRIHSCLRMRIDETEIAD